MVTTVFKVNRYFGNRIFPVILTALAVFPFAGCGDSSDGRLAVYPVLGTIQFRGQPISGAFLSLHPKNSAEPGAPSPRAMVAADGSFALSTYDGNDGAPEGEYVLTVQWYKPVRQGGELVGGPNVLPKKYASPTTSDVPIKVAAGENRLQPIQLR